MRYSVSKKMATHSGVGVAMLLTLGAVSAHGLASMSDAAAKLSGSTLVIRDSALVDMFHDATRSGLLDLVAHATSDDATIASSHAELDDAINSMQEKLDAVVLARLDTRIDAAVAAVQPIVDEFVARARAVGAAVTERRPFAAPKAEFERLFSVLEDQLPTVAKAVEEANNEFQRASKAASDRSERIEPLMTVLGIVALVLVGIAITKTINRPLRRTRHVLTQVAAGDLSQRVDYTGDDELGDMATALDTALDTLSATIHGIEQSAGDLASTSIQLSAVSSQLSESAQGTSTQASAVARAAEEVSTNVATVASGTGEMTASIQDISHNAQDAVTVAGNAAVVAASTTSTVAKLRASSAEIGSVVETITSIAEQTNLLALNAAIEAARAGEAGKGFAVVAHEVKELAHATASATADITARISAIQTGAEEAMTAIAVITAIIAQIGETQASIASAVEEQTATTGEMGRSITEAATGVVEIAHNIDGMAETAQHVSAGVEHTLQSAIQLAQLANDLKTLASRFTY